MKMLIAILKDNHAEPVSQALTAANFRVTRVASTSGFLRRGVVTLFLGIEDEQVEDAIEIIRSAAPESDNPQDTRATIFVTPVKKFTQI
jgi:uncharacterized protein YaaQ